MSIKLKGIAASPGVAIAPAFLRDRLQAPGSERIAKVPASPEAEWKRYEAAVEACRIHLSELRDSTQARLGELKAEIFKAHLSMLRDPELSASVRRRIEDEGLDAEASLQEAVNEFVDLLQAVDDEVFRARAEDVKDLGRHILAQLTEAGPLNPWKDMDGESIVVAESLSPSETSTLDPKLVLGFATAEGSATSHSSILARSMEIPAVVGLRGLVELCDGKKPMILDGGTGMVIIDPEPEELAEYRRIRDEKKAAATELQRFIKEKTQTRDGIPLLLAANIGGPQDSAKALAKGAEAVGLFRTEFLYMDRPDLPSEDEQCEAYGSVLAAFDPQPVIIRTLDIGGDKKVDSLKLEAEANPFLGVRAIRLCLSQEDIFRTQLRALLRASIRGKLRIMFPMIACVEELRMARKILEEERKALKEQGVAISGDISIGIMIEIPAAVTMAEQLAREADFFSVGTNDLVQYSMAADRMNPKLAYLNQYFHPAIVRALGHVAEAARGRGIEAGVCGEMGADLRAIPLLVGMGFTELSMNPASIPAARKAIANLDSAEARFLYQKARELATAEEVQNLIDKAINK